MIPSTFSAKVTGPPCTADDIKEFEEFAHASLPADYAEFLLNFNGCVPASHCDTFQSPIELPGGDEITVHVFYSLSDKCPSLGSLYAELEAAVGIMAMTSIPIGYDSFGNVFGLNLESGSIEWTLLEERFSDYMRIFELGVGFRTFIESLKAGPYEGQD